MERIVVKVGSSSITNDEVGLNLARIDSLARQIASLHHAGNEIALVASGTVAAGRFILGEKKNESEDLTSKQKAASFGLYPWSRAWGEAFETYGVNIGTGLLTGDDLIRPLHPLMGVLERGVALINANDVTNNEEMKSYEKANDNDQLSGHVAESINAGRLILLTDVEGVKDSEGQVIKTITCYDQYKSVEFGEKSKKGTGGMRSKLDVAWEAACAGRVAFIADAGFEDVILKIMQGEPIGTKVYNPYLQYLKRAGRGGNIA